MFTTAYQSMRRVQRTCRQKAWQFIARLCTPYACVHTGGDILQGLPSGQVKVAHSMLQDLNVDVVTNAMVRIPRAYEADKCLASVAVLLKPLGTGCWSSHKPLSCQLAELVSATRSSSIFAWTHPILRLCFTVACCLAGLDYVLSCSQGYGWTVVGEQYTARAAAIISCS